MASPSSTNPESDTTNAELAGVTALNSTTSASCCGGCCTKEVSIYYDEWERELDCCEGKNNKDIDCCGGWKEIPDKASCCSKSNKDSADCDGGELKAKSPWKENINDGQLH